MSTVKVVTERGAIVRENNAEIRADDCTVYGNDCVVYGNNCTLYGNNHVIKGPKRVTINGNNCTGDAERVVIRGNFNNISASVSADVQGISNVSTGGGTHVSRGMGNVVGSGAIVNTFVNGVLVRSVGGASTDRNNVRQTVAGSANNVAAGNLAVNWSVPGGYVVSEGETLFVTHTQRHSAAPSASRAPKKAKKEKKK